MRPTDGRPGGHGRHRARQLEKAWIRRNPRAFVPRVLFTALSVPFLYLSIRPGFGHTIAAFAAGGGFGLTAAMLAQVVRDASGSHRWRNGSEAETWVHDELAPLRKSGWHVWSGVSFRRRDVDHVVVGADRVIVIETKWCSGGFQLTADGVYLLGCDPLAQVCRNLRTIRQMLTGGPSGRIDGQALLIITGPASRDLGDRIEERQGVKIMGLPGLRRFVSELGSAGDDERARALGGRIEEHVGRRRAHQLTATE